MGGALGDARRSMLRQCHPQICQILLTVNGSVLHESLGKVESALEFAVVGIVVLIAHGHEVEVAAALVCMEKRVLS